MKAIAILLIFVTFNFSLISCNPEDHCVNQEDTEVVQSNGEHGDLPSEPGDDED